MERTLNYPAGPFSVRNLNGMILPVLIEVPAMESRTIRLRPTQTLRPFPRKRGRRRLKREVRAAVAALLIVMPSLGAGSWFVRNAREWSYPLLTVREGLSTISPAQNSLAAGDSDPVEVDKDDRYLHAPAIQPGVVVPVYGPDEESDHAGS